MLFRKKFKKGSAHVDEIASHMDAAKNATQEALGATENLKHIFDEEDGFTVNLAVAMGAKQRRAGDHGR